MLFPTEKMLNWVLENSLFPNEGSDLRIRATSSLELPCEEVLDIKCEQLGLF